MELNQLISVNFNLRKPKSSTPTPLYMVVYYVDDKGMKVQAKIPTGKKVHPSLWDSKRQQPIMINKGIDLTTNQLSEQAEVTAYITNCRILVYSEKNLNFDEIKEKINLKENNEMSPVTQQFISAKKTPKATKAMEAVLKSINESNKSENTKYAYRKNYNKWCEWLRDTKQVDSMKALSQLKFNEFKKWLVASGATNAMVNDTCGYIVRIIKEIVNGEGAIYGVKEVTFKKLATTSTNVKCELLEEIEALKDTKTISEREEFYKNVFLLQLATGQRISDTYTIIKGEYEVLKDGNGNGNEFIIIKNKKSTRGAKVKKSYIPMTKEVSDLLQVLQGNELIPTNDKTLTEYVNIEIKKIARRAGLTRITENGKPLCEKISSHYARHTVTTQLSRKGLSSEQIALQLGNSKEMVERVYKHETDTDIINKLSQPQPANTPAAANTPAPQVQAAAPAVAKDKDLEYYNNLSDDDKLLNTKKLNDYNVLKDDFFKSLERQTERKRKAAAEAKTREILQVWGFEGANDMNYKKLCFLLDLIKQDINDFILTYKVYNDEAPQGGMISAINDYERLLINIGKLTYYCHL